MLGNAPKNILGKKTREQILRDNEWRTIFTYIGPMIWIFGIILLIILERSAVINALPYIILLVCYIIATILFFCGLRCPFCDSLKRYDYWVSTYISVRKWHFKCHQCNLTDKQIKEIIDMLNRGIEINDDTIARFNRRDI